MFFRISLRRKWFYSTRKIQVVWGRNLLIGTQSGITPTWAGTQEDTTYNHLPPGKGSGPTSPVVAGDLDLWKCYFESNKTWSFSLVTLTVSQRILLHPAAPCSFHWMKCLWGSYHDGLWWHNNSDKSHSAYGANSLSTKINILVCLKKIIICN